MAKNKFRLRFSLISSGKNNGEKQIFIVCTIESKEIFYYSGYRVAANNFIKTKTENGFIYEVKKNTFNKARDPYTRINTRLKTLEAAAQLVYDKYYQDIDINDNTKDSFKKHLQLELGEYDGDAKEVKLSILDAYDKYYDESDVSDSRKKQYKSDKKRIKGYIDSQSNKINFDNFNVIKFRDYLLTKSNISENTLVIISKRIKAFFNYCKNRLKIIDTNPFDEIIFSKDIGVETYQEPICMTRNELTHLYNLRPRRSIKK